jgi:hypothetical protein
MDSATLFDYLQQFRDKVSQLRAELFNQWYATSTAQAVLMNHEQGLILRALY